MSEGMSGRPAPGRQVQAGGAMERFRQVLDQLGIDLDTGLTVLIVAAVAGIIAAILDRILELPTDTFFFTFGGFIAALSGPLYGFLKGKDSLGATIMGAVAGFVALLLWWIVMKIIGGKETLGISYNPWVEGINFFEVLLTGIVVGLLSVGWFALMRRLPKSRVRL